MQNKGNDNLKNYLSYNLGITYEYKGNAESAIKSLPIYLKNSFQMQLCEIEGHDFLILHPSDTLQINISQVASMAEKVNQVCKINIILKLDSLDSSRRRTLISNKINFIVPDKQVYLPSLCILLNERGLKSGILPVEKFLPSTQYLLLYHLQMDSLNGKQLKDIANQLQYSPKTVSFCIAELIKANICDVSNIGRSGKLLSFNYQGKELWGRVLTKLNSPIVHIWYTDYLVEDFKKAAKFTFDTALSHQTFISNSKQISFAIDRNSSMLKSLKQKNVLNEYEGKYRIEAWSYNPIGLTIDDDVDPLSLSLCYKNSDDERVSKELGILIDKMKW